MSGFRFKQFAIAQDRTAMKVGTDGVLVGAWAALRGDERRVLDIGTGTGLIALMLAQRAPGAFVTGIDIEPVDQARENADASPWGGRIRFVQQPVQTFEAAEGFDLIVSNPPFFVASLASPDAGRTLARHAVELPFGALCDAAVRLLAPGGRFALILPTAEGTCFEALCRGRLALRRRTEVCTAPGKPPKRVLLEFVRGTAARAVCDRLTIGTGAHEEYTPEYRALTKDFYLKF